MLAWLGGSRKRRKLQSERPSSQKQKHQHQQATATHSPPTKERLTELRHLSVQMEDGLTVAADEAMQQQQTSKLVSSLQQQEHKERSNLDLSTLGSFELPLFSARPRQQLAHQSPNAAVPPSREARAMPTLSASCQPTISSTSGSRKDLALGTKQSQSGAAASSLDLLNLL